MTDFLTAADLAAYFDREVSGALTNIVTRTNSLVTEEWANPVDPVPEWVTNIAWNVAIRAGDNPSPGKTSTTRSWDDVSITDRWEAGRSGGVFLTDEESRLLHGDTADPTQPVGVGSIQLKVPGWSRPENFPCY